MILQLQTKSGAFGSRRGRKTETFELNCIRTQSNIIEHMISNFRLTSLFLHFSSLQMKIIENKLIKWNKTNITWSSASSSSLSCPVAIGIISSTFFFTALFASPRNTNPKSTKFKFTIYPNDKYFNGFKQLNTQFD